jgi:hypothetical protein
VFRCALPYEKLTVFCTRGRDELDLRYRQEG